MLLLERLEWGHLIKEFGGDTNNKDDRNNEVIDFMMTYRASVTRGGMHVLGFMHQFDHSILDFEHNKNQGNTFKEDSKGYLWII